MRKESDKEKLRGEIIPEQKKNRPPAVARKLIWTLNSSLLSHLIIISSILIFNLAERFKFVKYLDVHILVRSFRPLSTPGPYSVQTSL